MADNIFNGTLTMNDDWGDVRQSGEAVGKGLQASGQSVQTFIKDKLNSKPGYFHTIPGENNDNILLGFADKTAYDNWDKTNLEDKSIITKTYISKGVPDPYFDLRIINKHSTEKYISTDGTVVLPIQIIYDYIKYDENTGKADIIHQGGSVELTVNAINGTTQVHETYIFQMDPLKPNDGHFNIDLTTLPGFGYGSWVVEMYCKATGIENGIPKEITSISTYIPVIKTEIDISIPSKWKWQEAQDLTGSNKNIRLNFDYKGDYVNKYLNIKITGPGDKSGVSPYTKYNISLPNDKTNRDITLSNISTDLYRLDTHGVHTVEYWINVDKDDNYSTPHKFTQIMVIGDKSILDPYIIINNLEGTSENSPLINWTKDYIMEYAVYAPKSDGGYENDYPIHVSFKNISNEEVFYDISKLNYGESKKIEPDLAIDTDSNMFALWVSFESDGKILNTGSPIQLFINNDGDYTPSTGAQFIFNPRIRSNDEPENERIKIYNTADNKKEEISSDINNWVGVNFNDIDGWLNDPINGSCLRLLDGQSLTIPFQPLKKLDQVTTGFTNITIELSFAVKNIINNEIPLIKIAKEDGDKLNGFELRGNDAYFLPNSVKSRDILNTHDVMFAEDEKIHMAICINQEKTTGDQIQGEIPLDHTTSADGKSNYDIVTWSKNTKFIRIYINGVLSRVVEFNDIDYDDATTGLVRNIVLGNTTGQKGADIDIYEIKIFQSETPKKDFEILKDYISSLSSKDQKDQVIQKNNILASIEGSTNIIREGKIDYEICSKKFNTLLWCPSEYSKDNFTRPNGREFGDTGKKSNPYRLGNLRVNYLGADGSLDPLKSGVLYNMSSEGQGTTAMLYFKWNQRYRFDDVEGENSSIIDYSYFVPERDVKNNETIDEEYKQSHAFYRLNDLDPIIGRLDGKINWASSMQSHKMGSVNLYHDCWKAVVGDSGLTKLKSKDNFDVLDFTKMGVNSSITTAQEAYDNACSFTGRPDAYGSCRVSVRQEPFMLFVQPKAGDTPVFYSMMTWGASKGDKPTFGYNKKFNKHFIMIEGTDNFRDLISCAIPWDDYHFEQSFDDDAVDGGIKYLIGDGIEQFEISMGDDSLSAIGTHWDGANPCLRMFKDMINFIYLCNPNIIRFEGTYEDLAAQLNANLSQGSENHGFEPRYLYWCTNDSKSGSNPIMGNEIGRAGDLYRLNKNSLDNNGEYCFVPAGMYKVETSGSGEEIAYYERLNLINQLGLPANILSITQSDQINQLFINKRIEKFKQGISKYIHVKDLTYTVQFLKLLAGTDNWSKNTYIYNTGLYYKQATTDAINIDGENIKAGEYYGGSAEYDGLDKFRFFQDDLDTIFEIDNYGAKTKPYYVEEHDYEINSTGEKDYYWNSQDNAMYYLTELAYLNDSENGLKTTMRAILNGMAQLGSTPINCFEKYYQNKAQNYFPETIYNTAAEKLYLDGYYRGAKKASDRYSMFLSQCLGGQKSAESEWQKKRIAYLSSYGYHGVFGIGTEGTGLAFTPASTIELSLTPHIWLYPSASEGSSQILFTGDFDKSFNVPGRVPAGQEFKIKIESSAGSENQVTLKGLDYYRDLGNLAKVKPLGGSFIISGERLSELNIIGTSNSPIEFDAYKQFEVSNTANPDNMRKIKISGNTINNSEIFRLNSVDLSKLWRLAELDMSATSVGRIKLKANSNIQSIIYPESILEIELDSQKNLTVLDIPDDAYKNLTSIKIIEPSPIIQDQIFNIITKCIDNKTPLNTLVLDNINWDLTVEQVEYLLNINNCQLSGNISIKDSNKNLVEISSDLKLKLVQKFGDVDKGEILKISYLEKGMSGLNNGNISGLSYIKYTTYNNGQYQYRLSNIYGNKIISINWEVDQNDNISISKDGILTFSRNLNIESVGIKCILKYYSAAGEEQSKEYTKNIHFTDKTAEIGDVIYIDGNISSLNDYNGTDIIVGICYHSNGNDRRMVALNSVSKIIPYPSNLNNYPFTWGDPSVMINTNVTIPITYKYHTPEDILSSNSGSEEDYYMGSLTLKDNMPVGKYNTNKIIEYRNKNLPNIFNIPGYDENGNYNGTGVYDEMSMLLNQIYQNNQVIESSYKLFPAASFCYAYDPIERSDENYNFLKSNYQRHNWYLPTISELQMIWALDRKGLISCTGKYESVADNREYQTSSEYNNSIQFTLRANGEGTNAVYAQSHTKNNQGYNIRPVCSF